MTGDVVSYRDEDGAHCDDGDFDPFPDDLGYESFSLERARLERKAWRLFGDRKAQTPVPTRRRSRSNRTRCFIRWLGHRMHKRASRSHRVARRSPQRCSSGVGNEPDGDPEPPLERPQSYGPIRDKNLGVIGPGSLPHKFVRASLTRAA